MLQPLYFLELSRDVLGDRYEEICTRFALPLTPPPSYDRYGVMLAVEFGTCQKVMLVTFDLEYLRMLALSDLGYRDPLTINEGAFILRRDCWADVSDLPHLPCSLPRAEVDLLVAELEAELDRRRKAGAS